MRTARPWIPVLLAAGLAAQQKPLPNGLYAIFETSMGTFKARLYEKDTPIAVSNFVALARGDLSVIIPLLNTTPLFNVIFSAVFLRNIETVTPRIVLGAIVMVTGVALITLG